jgi:hypothetical protein
MAPTAGLVPVENETLNGNFPEPSFSFEATGLSYPAIQAARGAAHLLIAKNNEIRNAEFSTGCRTVQ